MAHYEDLLAKLILEVTLEDDGLVETERQIPVLDAQGADLYFEPAPGPRNPAGCYSLVNRMTPGPTVLEPFSRAPSREWVARSCFRKQLQLYHNRCLEAERKERPLPAMQQMWILSPGRPDGVLSAYGFQGVEGFPPGLYALAEGFSVGLVVLSERPPR